MHDLEDITVLDREDCDLLHDALKAYICHLDMIKLSCRNPVMIDGMPIEQRIAKSRKLLGVVIPRTSKAKEKDEQGRAQEYRKGKG